MFRQRLPHSSQVVNAIVIVLIVLASQAWDQSIKSAVAQEDGYWATDSCYYDLTDLQVGCLYVEGADYYYLENATQTWYLVVVESDGRWTN